MDWIKDIKKFQKGKFKPSSKKWDYFLRNNFNIQIDLSANTLYEGYFKIKRDYEHYREEEKKKGNKTFSKNNYIVIFPNYGIRINCTKEFIDSIPLLHNVFNKKWKEKTHIIRYYDETIKKVMIGPQVYVSTCSLDMYLYNLEDKNRKDKENILESLLDISREFY